MTINFVVMTKDEPQAFRLMKEINRQYDPETDTLTVWDDYSSPEWLSECYSVAEGRWNVVQHRLNEDFSDHRNAALRSLPDEEWVLFLDADEMIQSGFISGIKSRIDQNPESDFLIFPRFNTWWNEHGNDQTPVVPPDDPPFDGDRQGRGILNGRGIYWKNRVHEVVTGQKSSLNFYGNPFTILHHRENTVRRYTYFYQKFGIKV